MSLKVLIGLVILVGFMDLGSTTTFPEYEVFDFFAGAARISRLARELKIPSASFDINYHSNPDVFDINSPAGFVFLGVANCALNCWG